MSLSPSVITNPESGGYAKTSIVEDRQIVDVLIKEYDHRFKGILENKNWGRFKSEKERNEKMLKDVLKMLDEEVKKTHGS